ncbi:hypothetical protein OG520_22800 [Streptomyces sp. NBC_00984]|uniref:hypothetical protein n=1 Tax=Streptomyces sp. NBC_00984 TaxID=2903700 RepID=UPI003864B62B|nr:hypothetical protein OG520_22800 [Streptomyces sp. NBC_00984]
MDAIQQHMIDSYRAAQRGELPPPLPGRHDWEVVREARDRRRFDAVIAGRPARGRRWAALRSLFTRSRGAGAVRNRGAGSARSRGAGSARSRGADGSGAPGRSPVGPAGSC